MDDVLKIDINSELASLIDESSLSQGKPIRNKKETVYEVR